LLIKMPPATKEALEGSSLRLAGNTFRLQELFSNEGLGAALGAAPGPRWYVADTTPGAATVAELWEMAHRALVDKGSPLAAPDVYIEPDLGHSWYYDNPTPCKGLGAALKDMCGFNDQIEELPRGPEFAWHLGPDFSQLKQARDQVAAAGPATVRLAILDVGFDFKHKARPEHLRRYPKCNFVDDGQLPCDASDPYERGLLRNPGHGTATIAILAGGHLTVETASGKFSDYLGGAPQAEVIAVRIATSVILMRTSAFAAALDYLIAPNGDPALRPDVVSMSMGGLASRAWAEVVNRAYEAGICLITAAGNNFPGSPESIVYPARFHRVIAACGVMANGDPYIRDKVPFPRMAGNYGPNSKMDTALAAYTPNMPWAEINCPDIVDMDGAGTSAATPQVAAAAALWLQKYKAQLHYQEPWQVVEAVRQALFDSADKTSPDCRTYFGQGLLRAADALAVAPAPETGIEKTDADDAWFPLLQALTGLGAAPSETRTRMLEVEALQLLQRDRNIEQTLTEPGLDPKQLKDEEVKKFLDAAIASGLASPSLKEHLREVYCNRFNKAAPGAPEKPAPGAPGTAKRAKTQGEIKPTKPLFRLLRGYAFDPEMSSCLETAHINEVVYEIPWEETLGPGPSGEYLEVIDHDPASGCFYAPVDLNELHLMATDGLPPSEGNPKFHQQMVYAVAMRTIYNFERALGRKALWSARMLGKDDREFVGQLRIYPHALRECNAYYHPGKKALLFGYFPATAADPGQVYPGGMVFTCLSHDIIAHETTHALLDGLHRRLSEARNEDQLAFHEAFADIVALFQHFSMPAVLRHQIGKARGDLRARNLLGELAHQFGQASGMHGALRSAIGKVDPDTNQWVPLQPDPTDFQRQTEPHARGALLVAAVFDAFLSIYETRTGDLLRLATSGTGVLAAGALHPDLVGRLSEEASMVAQHVLNICVRALDYCPPVDMTFGDYLRALITADFDLVPNDIYGYRVAFLEAFRRRGIYPRDLPTLSMDSLRWRPAEEDGNQGLLQDLFSELGEFVEQFQKLQSRQENEEVEEFQGLEFRQEMEEKGERKERRKGSREEMFELTRDWRIKAHKILKDLFMSSSEEHRQRLMAALGLDLTTGEEHFEVHQLRVSNKQGPDEAARPQILLYLIQEKRLPGEAALDGGPLTFSGGCTIIADLYSGKVKYYVRKNILSDSRRQRLRTFNAGLRQGLSPLYFGASPLSGVAQRFAMLHADREDG
jgi:Subtilase family